MVHGGHLFQCRHAVATWPRLPPNIHPLARSQDEDGNKPAFIGGFGPTGKLQKVRGRFVVGVQLDQLLFFCSWLRLMGGNDAHCVIHFGTDRKDGILNHISLLIDWTP